MRDGSSFTEQDATAATRTVWELRSSDPLDVLYGVLYAQISYETRIAIQRATLETVCFATQDATHIITKVATDGAAVQESRLP
jgi:hypothetical protein